MGAVLENCRDKDSVVNKNADYRVPIEDEPKSLQKIYENLTENIYSKHNNIPSISISLFKSNQKSKQIDPIKKAKKFASVKSNLKLNSNSNSNSKPKPKSEIPNIKFNSKSVSPIRSKNKSNPPKRKNQKSNDFTIDKKLSRSSSLFTFGRKILNVDSNKFTKKDIPSNEEFKYFSSEFRRKRNEENLNSLKRFKEKLSSNKLIHMDFRLQMLDEFNLIRTNCLSYCNKIRSSMKFIENFIDKKYLTFFDENDEFRNFRVLKGVTEFEETINFLQNFNKKLIGKKKLEKLDHIDDLKIPFPEFDINLAKDADYIKNNFDIIKEKLKGKYEVTNYHYDITYEDSEISTLMQIVDDNYGNKKRQKNILRRSTKYVGINYGKLEDNLIVVYLVFAK
jgi:hypothetical protein